MDVFLIADVNGGKLEHVHAGEVVEIEVGDVLVVGQQLFVSLQVEHLGAEERVCSNSIDLIGQYRVDADVGTVLEVNAKKVVGAGFFGKFPADIE